MIRKAAKYLGAFPLLKRNLKFLYQWFNYQFNKSEKLELNSTKLFRISGEQGGFFGYYDKSPENLSGKLVAFQTPPGRKNVSYVKILNQVTGAVMDAGTTTALNLQAGSRLQWVDEINLVYNVYDDKTDKYGSVVFNTMTGIVRKNPYTVYDQLRKVWLTVNYKNLFSCGSEYGYNEHRDKFNDNDPVVLRVELETKSVNEILNFKTMQQLLPGKLSGKNHHFNHVMISPMANRFIFIFRWNSMSGRKEVLGVYDLENNHAKIVNHEMVSHCCWKDNDHITGYLSHEGKPGFYNINVITGKFASISALHSYKDGHPSWKSNRMVFDCYPGKDRLQRLYIFENNKVKNVGGFYSPLTYHEYYRCDLHPRFSSNGEAIYFDSMHEGRRHLYMIEI